MIEDDATVTHLQIGEVSARTELSIKTIRHYDDVGLVEPSARSAGGFRLYTTDDVNRLLVIRRMKPLGFALEEMRELLTALETLGSPTASPGQRTKAATHIAECHTRAKEACVTIAKQLAYAHELTDQLASYAG